MSVPKTQIALLFVGMQFIVSSDRLLQRLSMIPNMCYRQIWNVGAYEPPALLCHSSTHKWVHCYFMIFKYPAHPSSCPVTILLSPLSSGVATISLRRCPMIRIFPPDTLVMAGSRSAKYPGILPLGLNLQHPKNHLFYDEMTILSIISRS